MAYSRYRRRGFKRPFRRSAYSRYRKASFRPKFTKRRFRKRAFRNTVKPEMKCITGGVTNQTIGYGIVTTTTPNQHPFNCITLNCIAEGTGPTSRIGRQITNKSILINGSLNNFDQNLGSKIRLYLILDKAPNGDTYSGLGGTLQNDDLTIAKRWAELKGTIWDNTNSIMDGESAMTAVRAQNHLERFKILKTLNINLSQRSGASYSKKNFKIYQKLKSKTMFTTSAAYPIEKNELLLVIICDTPTADKDSTEAGVQLDMNTQFKFTDV